MEKQRINRDKFSFVYYANGKQNKKGLILSLGNSDENFLVKGAAGYFTSLGCDVIALCPVLQGETYDGWHSFPMEVYGEAIACFKEKGIEKIGTVGGSTTAMVSLAALSLYPELSLGLIYTGCDFLFEGVYVKEGKSGKLNDRVEVPAHGHSCLSWQGADLPYSPYGLDDEKYKELAYGSAKKYGELNGHELYDTLEAQPEFERGLIPVEKARARIIAFSAEDDTLWRTVKYMSRLKKRLEDKGYAYGFELHTYEHGTHFIYPQGMMLAIAKLPFIVRFALGRIFKAGKQYPMECQQTRIEAGRITERALTEW